MRSQCLWTIECSDGGVALLEFTAFATESRNDYINLADRYGADIGGGPLSGEAVPMQAFGARGGQMQVAFHSDSAHHTSGFAAEYWCGLYVEGCTDPVASNFDKRATIDDGSCIRAACVAETAQIHANESTRSVLDFSGGYEDNKYCGWRFECSGELAALLQFTSFATESTHDYVNLADDGGADIGGRQLSGDVIPAQIFGAKGGALTVVFQSDGSVTADGFVAQYWCADPATVGCTDPSAANINPRATADDGSCITSCGPDQDYLLHGTMRRQPLEFTGGWTDRNGAACGWRVDCGRQAVLFEFTAFGDAHLSGDFIEVDNGNGAVIGQLSGNSVFPQNYGAQGGSLVVTFHTTSTRILTGTDGFTAEYWCADPTRRIALGCTDPVATNFNALATAEDGSCAYDDGPALRDTFKFGLGIITAADLDGRRWAGASLLPSWVATNPCYPCTVNRAPCPATQWDGVLECTGGGRVRTVSLSDREGLGRFELGEGGLTGLKGLASLLLVRTGLSGTLPPEIDNLTGLVTLDLSSTGLSGTLPPAVGRLTGLETLRLFGTRLSGTLSSVLGTMKSLLDLSLFGTSLSGTLMPEVSDMTSLETLRLFNTRLSGTLPAGLCVPTLDFHNCNLDGNGTARCASPLPSSRAPARLNTSLSTGSVAVTCCECWTCLPTDCLSYREIFHPD